MQLNGSMLNGAALDGSSGARTPVLAVAGQAYVWAVRLLVGGVDMSANLVGVVEVDREEGAAGLATFSLHVAQAVSPADWIGRPVSIDYLSTSSSGNLDTRRFTGRVTLPSWAAQQRILTCECSDQLQQRVEAMAQADIDALLPSSWSVDVFDPLEGRSRWDYAGERLATRPASLDCSPHGALRLTSWYADPVAHFVFGSGTTLDESVDIELADLSRQTNVVEIEYSYRFSRLWQLNEDYSWAHPNLGGFTGEQGFCLWRGDSTELPDIEMIMSAASAGGQAMLSTATYQRLPLTGVYCDPPAAWVNTYPDLLLAAAWTGARRWVQPVTETYSLRLEADSSVAQSGEIVSRESHGFSIDSEAAAAWESTPFGMATPQEVANVVGGTGPSWSDGSGFGTGAPDDGVHGFADHGDSVRRAAAAQCLFDRAVASIVAAHRATTVSFAVPTSLCTGVDLVHTARLEDQGVRAQGKVRRIVDRLDLRTGAALTTLSIAVMRGGGTASDPLALPSAPIQPPAEGSGFGVAGLPTQLGGRSTSPPYDPDLLGFSGNYSTVDNNVGQERYPRRMKIAAQEIAAELRDELVAKAQATYRLAIPNDLLEL